MQTLEREWEPFLVHFYSTTLDQDSNPAVLGDESAQVVALQRQGGDDVDGRSEAGLGFGGRKGFNAQLKQIN